MSLSKFVSTASKSQYLVKNGQAVAIVLGETVLKTVSASSQTSRDALNAQYPAVLVNASTYKVSSAKKYQSAETAVYAKPLEDGRPDSFLLF